MYNDSIELLKFVGLDKYDYDSRKTNVYVDPNTYETTIHFYLNRRIIVCPFCKSNHTVIKETIIKKINHCISPEKKITILFNQKKFKCKECGHNFMENNPIGDSISYFGEYKMILALKNPRKTFSDVAKEYFTSIQNVINHFDKRVNLNRHKLTKIICFDEFYSRKLTTTKYSFCIFDPVSNTVLDILDARRKNILELYFSEIPEKERLYVKFINVDMWQTYVDIAESYLPNATICVDSFHVIKHLNEAMKKARLAVQKKFIHEKDNYKRGYYWLLKSFHYFFVEDFEKIKYERRKKSRFSFLYDKYQVLEKLLSIDKDLANAYHLKEEYREFNLTEEYSVDSITKIEDYVEKFKRSPFKEFQEFGYLLSHWKIYIANSFIRVNGKRMSNGPMESVNSRIRRLLQDGYGYSVFERFRNRVLFSLNKNEPIKI